MVVVWNFAAGPARLPDQVLVRAKSELTSYKGCGMSVLEMSHRSPEFESIIKTAEANIRKLLKIPDNYKVLFLQGGACTQFSAVPLNLLNVSSWNAPVDYVVTGAWSQKAAEEVGRYAKNVNIAYDGKAKKYTTVDPFPAWKLSQNAAYVYYCQNETIHGVELTGAPDTKGVPLVCDMSSNFLSRPVDVSKYGVIFAGAQKNAGPAGVTIVIVREDLLGQSLPCTPLMLDWKLQADNQSLYNTPPTFSIYIAGLVFEWILNEVGGLEKMELLNIAKSQKLYGVIDSSQGFYSAVVEPLYRSRMNVPFRIKGGNEKLEKEFLSEATKSGLLELKGHRSIGGLRASIYNAMPMEGVVALTTFMEVFMVKNTTVAVPAPVPMALDGRVSPIVHAPKKVEQAPSAFKVLIADKCDATAVKMLKDNKIQADEKSGLKENQLVEIIGDYDALVVRSATTVTANIIKAGKKLKIIGRAGVGVDNVDLVQATKQGIIVVNSPQGNTTSAAEHTWAMIMSMVRQIPQAHGKLAQGTWDRKSFMGVELEGKTLAILGFGNIGKKVAGYAKAFGMKVNAYDPYVPKEQGAKLGVSLSDQLDQVLNSADVITLHLPATKDTSKLINARAIAGMKKGVMIVNVARGECVDEHDLADALKSGHVAAAALDVFAPEPLDPKSPLLHPAHPNLIVTPHLGASTVEAQVKVAVDVIEQIIEVFKGGPARAAVNIPSMKPHLIQPVKHMLGIAEKLGSLTSQLARDAVNKVELEITGLNNIDISPLTTCFLKGMLDIYSQFPGSVNFVNAPTIAKERGLQVETKVGEVGRFSTLISVTAYTQSGKTVQLGGTSFSDLGDRLVQMDGLPVDVVPQGWMLLISSPDVPGMIGKVGSFLGKNGINISTMEVGRFQVGGKATMICCIDTTVSDAILQEMTKCIPEIWKATLVYI